MWHSYVRAVPRRSLCTSYLSRARVGTCSDLAIGQQNLKKSLPINLACMLYQVARSRWFHAHRTPDVNSTNNIINWMALETTGDLIRYKVRHFADIQLTQTGAGGPRTHKPHERFFLIQQTKPRHSFSIFLVHDKRLTHSSTKQDSLVP